MIRSCLLVLGSAALVGVAPLVASAGTPSAVAPSAAAPSAIPTTLSPGHPLTAGRSLRSANGRLLLTMAPGGRARLMLGERTLWSTGTAGPGSALVLRRNGNLVVIRQGRIGWQSGTRGAGLSQLSIGAGAVTVTARYGTVWTSGSGNRCGFVDMAREVVVSLSAQRAWLCAGHEQVLTTPVTTGATSRGDATPTGTWQVYAKTRNTTLYPSGGGAYPVHYWMPYNGAYGLHDAPWQHFPYGSARYHTNGSHGCVHVPEAAMRFLFGWARIGTTVTIGQQDG